ARKTDPGNARIAIGFTSEFQITKGRTHLGGTRGPLNNHILLREWSQVVSEPERLELLVHELGHFLGAVHSPEPDSVMRIILGDRQARVRKFQIHFDPLNTLAMNLVAEEWRKHPLYNYAQMSLLTQARLRAIYGAISQTLPEDNSSLQYLRILDRTAPRITIGPQ
ncbi:MAG TPA: matrixin family metalloprotease, partial [Pirellulales bacterium]